MSETGVGAPRNENRQIAGLDLLRGFAALLVLLFHYGFWTWRGPKDLRGPNLSTLPISRLFARGWVGVEIFFVLSGFVIAYSTEGATPRRFIRHRLQRLLPAALICATVTACVRLFNHQEAVTVGSLWLRSVVFWPREPWIDGSYWTLPVELSFYLLVLLSLLWAKGRYLVPIMGGVGVISAVNCFLLFSKPSWVSPGLLRALDSCWFPPHACSLAVYGVFFALGVVLFSTLRHGTRWQHVCLLPVCLAGCIAEICWHAQRSGGDYLRMEVLVPLALWLFGIAVLVFSVRSNSWIKDRLGAKGVRLSRQVGLTTYPLYLVHAEIGEWMMHVSTHRVGYGISLALVSSIMIATGTVIALYMEPKLRRLLSRRILGRPSEPVITDAVVSTR